MEIPCDLRLPRIMLTNFDLLKVPNYYSWHERYEPTNQKSVLDKMDRAWRVESTRSLVLMLTLGEQSNLFMYTILHDNQFSEYLTLSINDDHDDGDCSLRRGVTRTLAYLRNGHVLALVICSHQHPDSELAYRHGEILHGIIRKVFNSIVYFKRVRCAS